MTEHFDKSFVFYGSFWEQIKNLDEKTRLKFSDAIFTYGITGERPTCFSAIENAVWIPIENAIDNAKKKRNDSVEFGKKGGRPKKETLSEEKPEEKPEEKGGFFEKRVYDEGFSDKNLNVNVNVNDNVNDNVNENVNEECEIIPPKAETDKPSNKKNHYKIFFESKVKKEYEEIIKTWIKYKRAKNQGYPNLDSLVKMQDELIKCGGGTVSGVRAVVDSAIAKGYNGFFALRNPPPDVGQSDYNAEYIKNLDWKEFEIQNDEEKNDRFDEIASNF